MRVSKEWARQDILRFPGTRFLRQEILTEKERWEKRREDIKANNPEDPRIALEKKLGLPSGSILLLNGILVLAETRESIELQDVYAA